MKLLILSGGFGTRLSDSIGGLPKILAPVGDKTFFELIIRSWRKQGFSDFTFLLHYKADVIEKYIQKNKKKLFNGCSVDIITELEPLGTGGAIAHAISKINLAKSFLVANADTWIENGLVDISTALEPCIGVVKIKDAARFGRVVFDSNNLVRDFIEKDAEQGPGWINAGIYHLNSKIFEGWNGEQCSLERNIFPSLVIQKKLLAVPLKDSTFIDIGVPTDYNEFVSRFK